MRPQAPRALALTLVTALLAAVPSRAAERHTIDVSAGVYQGTDPSQTGLYIGLGARLLARGRFSLAITADYVRMHKDVVQGVTAGGPDDPLVVVEDNQDRHYIPAFLTANFGLGDEDNDIRPYLIGSIGWATVRSYHDNVVGSNSRSFFGPVFEGGLGVSFSGRFFVEGSVHGGSVERSGDERRLGTPPDEEASPTGVAIRGGFRF